MSDGGGNLGPKEAGAAGGVVLLVLTTWRYLMSWASPEQRRIDAEQREELRRDQERLRAERDEERERANELQNEVDRLHETNNEMRTRVSDLEMNACENGPDCPSRKKPERTDHAR